LPQPSPLTAGEGQVVSLPAHRLRNQADTPPGAEPRLEHGERRRLGGIPNLKAGETKDSEQKLAALFH
jgi:hypothetical protein